MAVAFVEDVVVEKIKSNLCSKIFVEKYLSFLG